MTASARKILHTLAIVVIWSMIDATIMDQIVTLAAFKLFGKYVYRKPAPGAGGPAVAALDDNWLHEPTPLADSGNDAIIPLAVPLGTPSTPVETPGEAVPIVPPPASPRADGTGRRGRPHREVERIRDNGCPGPELRASSPIRADAMIGTSHGRSRDP